MSRVMPCGTREGEEGKGMEAATMHAFKQSLSHPPAVAASAVITVVNRSPMDASKMVGRGWLSFPSKGGVLGDVVGEERAKKARASNRPC